METCSGVAVGEAARRGPLDPRDHDDVVRMLLFVSSGSGSAWSAYLAPMIDLQYIVINKGVLDITLKGLWRLHLWNNHSIRLY